jgi:hypothetical protein
MLISKIYLHSIVVGNWKEIITSNEGWSSVAMLGVDSVGMETKGCQLGLVMLQVMSLAANLKAPMALLCSIAFGRGGPAIAPPPDWSHLPPIPARTTSGWISWNAFFEFWFSPINKFFYCYANYYR